MELIRDRATIRALIVESFARGWCAIGDPYRKIVSRVKLGRTGTSSAFWAHSAQLNSLNEPLSGLAQKW